MEVYVILSCFCLRCVFFICFCFIDEVDNLLIVYRVFGEKRNEFQFDEDEESKFKGLNIEKEIINFQVLYIICIYFWILFDLWVISFLKKCF